MALTRSAVDEKTQKTPYRHIGIEDVISFIGTNIDFFAAPFLNYEYLDLENELRTLDVPEIQAPAKPPKPSSPTPAPALAPEPQAQEGFISSCLTKIARQLGLFSPDQTEAKQPEAKESKALPPTHPLPSTAQHIGKQFQEWIQRPPSSDHRWKKRLCRQLNEALNEEDAHTWNYLLCSIPNFEFSDNLFFKRDPGGNLRKLLEKNHDLLWAIQSFMLNATSPDQPHVIDKWYEECALPEMRERRYKKPLFWAVEICTKFAGDYAKKNTPDKLICLAIIRTITRQIGIAKASNEAQAIEILEKSVKSAKETLQKQLAELDRAEENTPLQHYSFLKSKHGAIALIDQVEVFIQSIKLPDAKVAALQPTKK